MVKKTSKIIEKKSKNSSNLSVKKKANKDNKNVNKKAARKSTASAKKLPKFSEPKTLMLGRKTTRKRKTKEFLSENEEDSEAMIEQSLESEGSQQSDSDRDKNLKKLTSKKKNKVGSKINVKARQTPIKKKFKEEEEEESESENEINKTKRKQPRKSKSKSKKKVTPSESDHKPKKQSTTKLSSEISLQTLSKDKYFDSKDPDLITDCCIQCNNRNVIRAVETSDPLLLKKCISATSEISTLNDFWSLESGLNPFEVAIQNEDKQMFHELTTYFTNLKSKSKKRINRVNKPISKLKKLETGSTGFKTFGFRVRNVNVARGNRQGNNAFLDDIKRNLDWKRTMLNSLYKHSEQTSKFIPFLNLIKFPQEFLNFNQIKHKPEKFINVETNIYTAVDRGNRNLAYYFLNKLKNADTFGFNELHKTVLTAGPNDTIEIKNKMSVNKKSRLIMTPVHFASINPNEKVLKVLLDNGGDYNNSDLFNRKPIHYAAACEGEGPLKLLISKGANVNDREKNKFTPLLYAAKNGRVENVKLLIKHGAEVNYKPYPGANKAIHWACLEGHFEVVKYLLSLKDIDMEATGAEKMTPLHCACKAGHEDIVELLLNKGANVNSKDKFKRTPFLLATKSGFPRIVAILLNQEADFNLADNSGNTPLHYACAYGWMENVKILLTVGADINAVNAWKTTPLEVAVLKNHFGIVKYILNSSLVDVNTRFDKGNTILLHSLLNITPKTVEQIIFLVKDKKCDVTACNFNKETPLHLLAKFTIDKYIHNFIPNFGIGVKNVIKRNAYIKKNKSKLENEHRNLIKTLIELFVDFGCDVNAEDMNGRSPIFKAMSKKEEKISPNKQQPKFKFIPARRTNIVINSEIKVKVNYPFIFELLKFHPDLLRNTKKGDNIIHLLSNDLFQEENNNLWRIVFDQIKEDNLKDKIKEINLLNSVNKKGFTPILKLSYEFSKRVYDLYNTILGKETLAFKLAKKDKENSLDKKKKVASSSKKRKRERENISKIINNLILSKEEREKVKLEAGLKFIKFLNDHFISFFITLCDLGSDPHSTVKASEEHKGEKPKYKNITHKIHNNYRIAPTRSKIMSKKAIKEKKKKTKIEKLTENYFEGFGLTNSLMFLMTFPLLDLIKPLIEKFNIDINQKDVLDQNCLFYLLKHYKNINKVTPDLFNHIFDYLTKEKGIDINTSDVLGNSPFFLCASKSYTEEAIKLFALGADVNQPNEKGENALIYHVKNKNSKKVEWLLRNFREKITINQQDIYKRTALHYVMINDDVSRDIDFSILSLLLNLDIDPNVKDFLNRTPVFYLFIKDSEYETQVIDPIASLSFLLEIKNVDLNVKDVYGNTVMFYAIQRSSSISLATLLAKGAFVDVSNKEGNTPLTFSVLMSSHINMSELVAKGANVHRELVFPLAKRNVKFEKEEEDKMEVDKSDGESLLLEDEEEDEGEYDEDNDSEEESEYEQDYNENENEEEGEDEDEDEQNYDEIEEENINEDESESESEEEELNESPYEEDKISFDFQANNIIYTPTEIEQDKSNNMTPYFKNSITIFGKDKDSNDNADKDQNSIKSESKESNPILLKKQLLRQSGVSVFRACVCIGLQGLIYYILNQEYDVSKALFEVFSERKYNLALLLIGKTFNRGVYSKNNEKGETLFHAFINESEQSINEELQAEIFEKLYSRGVPLDTYDNEGYLPIHYACKVLNKKMIELILSKSSVEAVLDAKTIKEGYFPLICCFLGDNVGKNSGNVYKSVRYILKRMKQAGEDVYNTLVRQVSLMYKEECVSKDYYTTPLNRVAYYYAKAVKEKGEDSDNEMVIEEKESNLGSDNENENEEENEEDNEEEQVKKKSEFDADESESEASSLPTITKVKLFEYHIIKMLVENGAHIMEKDSKGKDILIYSAIENRPNIVFDCFLTEPHISKQIQYDSVDNEGKSFIHYIIQPFEFGTYENIVFLKKAIKAGFKYDIIDNHGSKPINYAYLQQSGIFYNFLSKYDKISQMQPEFGPTDVTMTTMNPVNYEEDSHLYFNMMMESTKDDEKFEVLIDPVAKLNPKSNEVYKDIYDRIYDVTLTKVDIGRMKYGIYLFYKMQIIHDKARDFYILWNRWGRMGTQGAYQRTPFNNVEEAVKEFKKIFKEKTKNDWDKVKDYENFEKKPKKFMMIKLQTTRRKKRDFLTKFNLDEHTPQSTIAEEIRNLIQHLTKKSLLFRIYKNNSINKKAFSLSLLNDTIIEKAKEYLENIKFALMRLKELKEQVDKLEKSIKEIEDDISELNKINEEMLKCHDIIQESSSRYYELIPKNELGDGTKLPIQNENDLHKEQRLMTELTYVETTVKILLGALYRQREINPIDYCCLSLDTKLCKLDEESSEWKCLKKYIDNTLTKINQNMSTIFAVDRRGELDRENAIRDNCYLLFHGTKVYNIMGILSQGLKITPVEAASTGTNFDEGIYFADKMSKAYNYCEQAYFNNRGQALSYSFNRGEENKTKKVKNYVLLCEVSLGRIFEHGWTHEFKSKAEVINKNFNSVKALASNGPDLSKSIVLNNGTIIPQGEIINYEYPHVKKPKYDLRQDAEYIVYREDQVRIRYIVELEENI